MGRKKVPGLQKRFGVWQIDKSVCGQRICESTGTSNLEEAERYLVHRVEQLRSAHIYGIRPSRTFREAAEKYLRDNQHKASIDTDLGRIKGLLPFIGDNPIESIHIGTLQVFIETRQRDGVKAATINHGLKVVRRILNLAATEWFDEQGLTWLHAAPKIKLLKVRDHREPYPLSWDEQDRLFAWLPDHLRKMALFTVNTGCRDAEVCNLKWEWEFNIGNGSVFIIPAERVKNRENRLVVLNDIAKSIIESVRGNHPEYVFVYKNRPMKRMLSNGWRAARLHANLPLVRVHDLKHTFGRRLRAAGVSFEDRQDLLGHKSGRITTHYSAAELDNLIHAANRVCDRANCGVLLKLVQNHKTQRVTRILRAKKKPVLENRLTA